MVSTESKLLYLEQEINRENSVIATMAEQLNGLKTDIGSLPLIEKLVVMLLYGPIFLFMVWYFSRYEKKYLHRIEILCNKRQQLRAQGENQIAPV